MASEGSVHVFDYVDYRQYLRDFYREQKGKSRAFSHRAFSRRAGLRSSNYLSLVMKGARDLSSEMASRFAKACGLVKSEADFFCELVAYGQAKSTEEKQRAQARLSRFRRFREAHRLLDEQTAYHQNWYIPAIRELTNLRGFREEARWIAEALEPPISERQAQEALVTLETLGLLVRDADGRLRQAEPLLTTGPGPLGHQVFVYHHAMLDLAKRALDELPREERDISCLTLSVSERALPAIKQRLAELRRELLQLAELDTGSERVVQLNLQLFPLSRRAAKSAPRALGTAKEHSKGHQKR